MSDTITVVYETVPFDVTFYATPIIPASRDGHPDNWMPEEGGDFELLSVKVEGHDITPYITDWMEAALAKQVREQIKC